MADHQADTKTQMNDLPCHMPPHSLQTHDANREPPKSDISAHSLKLEMLTEYLPKNQTISALSLQPYNADRKTNPNMTISAQSLQPHDAHRVPPKSEDVSSFSSNSRC